ncbi:hypothetical protein EDC04DRAFT_2600381 [Pisolithus marmoratus]|nr:hypothetical protein EDC04DRAFT_2600381 [Pisolithus marmoratus]
MPAEEVDRVADAVVKRLPYTDDIAAKVMEKLMPALKGMLQEVLQSSTCHQGQSEKRDKGKGKETSTSHGGLMDGNKMMMQAIMISTTRAAQQQGQGASGGENKFKFIPLSPASDATLQAMQALLRNPKATWRSKEQQACMVTVLEGQRDLIAVLGTEAGKSMLAIVPSITQPDRATILVLPLNLLLLDYQQCLEEWRLVLLSTTLPPWCIEEAKSTFQLTTFKGRAGQDRMDNQQAAIPSYLQHHQCQTYSMQDWRESQDGPSMNCYIAMGQGDASDMASLFNDGQGIGCYMDDRNEGCLVCCQSQDMSQETFK